MVGSSYASADTYQYMPWIWNAKPVICVIGSSIGDNETLIVNSITSWYESLDKYTGSDIWNYPVIFSDDSRCNVKYYLGSDISMLKSNEGQSFGYTDCNWDANYNLSCSIKISSTVKGNLLGYVLEHETGHMLGLGHRSNDKQDIMYPNIQFNATGQNDICITNSDLDAMLLVYEGADGNIGYNDTEHTAKNSFFVNGGTICVK